MPDQTSTEKIDLHDLAGRWYIHLTNFPMWTKGDKLSPTFNYAVMEKNGETVLSDTVIYTKDGQPKSIEGYDYPGDKNNRKFTWRGKGLLSLLKSRWEILFIDQQRSWAVIHFDKTLFTPEGYDVISRKKDLTLTEIEAMKKKLSELDIQEEMTLLEH